MSRKSSRMCALVAVVVSGIAFSQAPIAVALMTGLNPGANPGMAILNGKLQATFGGGPPTFTSQVFGYTDQSGAASFLAAAGPSAQRVLIGHSWGASSNFALAQNNLGPMGLNVALQISVDWVSQSSPFTATTPTVPPQILLAYNYHQNSNQFLEPVPSQTILGAARNLDMEIEFADSGLVHTSVDDDARVHALIISRVRELFTAPPFPGTGEHLDLFGRVDTLNVGCNFGSGISSAGVLSQNAVQTVQAGQWITLRAVSAEGDFTNAPCGILGEVFATGSPPASALPGIASSLAPGSIFLITPGAAQLPPFTLAPMPAAGFNFSTCWPAGLAGTSVVIQAVVVLPSAQNGIYASSLGIEIRGI